MSLSDYFAAQQRVWFRYRHRLPDDDVAHVCVLAYMSDMTLLGSASSIHRDEHVQSASLDHAMWFLRPFRADEWLFLRPDSPGRARARLTGPPVRPAGTPGRGSDPGGLARTLIDPSKHGFPEPARRVTAPTIGVPAVQGDVREHVAALRAVGADPRPVRRPAELDGLDGIVLPGGESTTISKLLGVFELFDPLHDSAGAGAAGLRVVCGG